MTVLPISTILLEHHGETLFRPMQSWLEQKRVPPVLLLCGPQGIGKREIAFHLAQWLLCSETGFSEQEGQSLDFFGESKLKNVDPQVGRPCGQCQNCKRALSGNWLDFFEISVDLNNDESQSLKIEHFRKLKESLGFSAFEGAFKITLIRDAEKMTPQAANSVLKILEEPPPGWIFLLTAPDPSVLISTLVSRCQVLRLKPLSAANIENLLLEVGATSDQSIACAKLVNGNWKKAVSMLGGDFWDKRARFLRFMEKPSSELNEIVDWAGQSIDNCNFTLDTLEQLLEEQIKTSTANEKMVIVRNFWITQSERIYKAREELKASLNKKLLIQDILLPFLKQPH